MNDLNVIEWPELLKPNSFCILPINGTSQKIGMATPILPPWVGVKPNDTYGGKPIVNLNGTPTFAELFLLECMRSNGWQGAWIDSYKQKYRVHYFEPREVPGLPDEPRKVLSRILGHSNFPKSCWDLVCWKGRDKLVFVEAKRKSKDKIRDSQIQFIERALSNGLHPNQFLIVEWEFGDSPKTI